MLLGAPGAIVQFSRFKQLHISGHPGSRAACSGGFACFRLNHPDYEAYTNQAAGGCGIARLPRAGVHGSYAVLSLCAEPNSFLGNRPDEMP
jgi:hypothetical protein